MKKAVMFGFIFMLFISMASAELLFSQPEQLYNFGDTLSLELDVHTVNSVSDFLTMTLVCPNGNIELYRNTISMNANEERSVPLQLVITKTIIGETIGNCHIEAKYAGDTTESQNFEITKEIIIEATVDKVNYGPNEVVKVRGTAVKANGDSLEGFAEMDIDGQKLSTPVRRGNFDFNFTLAPNVAPGLHTIDVRAYERNNGDITNEGSTQKSLRVREVLTRIEIIMTEREVSPPASVIYHVAAYDQASNAINRDVQVKIINPNELIVSSGLKRTGNQEGFSVPRNETPGDWRIEASAEGITASYLYSVLEVQNVEFEIVNDTLIVTNIGNVEYNKPLEIIIGDFTLIRPVQLGVDETKRLKLFAPDNNYDVSINDGIKKFSQTGVALTGRSIDVGEIGNVSFAYFLPALLVILCLGGLMLFSRIKYTTRNKAEPVVKKYPKADLSKTMVKGSVFMEGVKEDGNIVAIKFHNVVQNDEAKRAVENIRLAARSSNVHVQDEGDYLLLFATPKLSMTEDFGLHAAKVASEISKIAENYNRMTRNKVNIGIGVAKGSLITDNYGRSQRFSSLDNAISKAKKLASTSKGEVLLSHAAYKAVSNTIKADRFNEDAWKMREIVNRDKHNGFIEGFKKRYDK